MARELALLDDVAAAVARAVRGAQPAGTGRRGAARLLRRGAVGGAVRHCPRRRRRCRTCTALDGGRAPLVLLHSQDPANLYGSGAPFDIPLLDGGTRPLLRRPGNWLVLESGRPVLLVEQQGRKLTALPSAAASDVVAAAKCCRACSTHQRGLAAKHKLTVEEWNGQPVTTTPGKAWLEAAGFVRDYQGMTLYAAWR